MIQNYLSVELAGGRSGQTVFVDKGSAHLDFELSGFA
jgi:hypothetical protein